MSNALSVGWDGGSGGDVGDKDGTANFQFVWGKVKGEKVGGEQNWCNKKFRG
jgi:hypothetical protein